MQSKDWIIILSLILLNFVVKYLFVDFPEIGGDEPFSMFYANADIETYMKIIHTENNPPLYLFLLKGWIKLFGMSPISVRFMSLLFSSLTAGFVFRIGKRYFNYIVGILAALLFTFASYHMEFAHQARVYALFGLLTVASMYSFFRLVIDNQKKHGYLIVLYNVLLIYSHFFGFFVIFIQFLCALSIKDIRSSKLKTLFIGWIITALAYLPFIGITIHRFTDSASATWQEKPGFVDLYNNLWNFSNQPVNTVIFLLLLLTGAGLYLIKKKAKEVSVQTKVILIWFIVPYLLMFVVSFVVPMFLYRYLIYISFAYYFLIAVALSYLIRNQLYLAISSGLLVIMMIFTCNYKAGNDRNDKEIILKIKEINGENTSVLLCPHWHFLLFSYHYNEDMFRDYKHVNERLENEGIYPLYRISSDIEKELNESDTIIFYDAWASLVDPDMTIKAYLDSHYEQIGDQEIYEGTTLTYYLNKKHKKKE